MQTVDLDLLERKSLVLGLARSVHGWIDQDRVVRHAGGGLGGAGLVMTDDSWASTFHRHDTLSWAPRTFKALFRSARAGESRGRGTEGFRHRKHQLRGPMVDDQ